ncbi:uncharacterized protein TRIADDRAFT_60432 [Trichoplax adhaerens]|uniref:Uncharacterized protein n=1 Tax=Trichoplax adhaerens TaxID=10228 RepID=B3S872_TRIAD|nr:predicted protein [Trichoplax adhaerens]EDV21052.1 predicted protein [Trichoplax adhaerens]|eukprot:XP_002116382.1 predicted protein [Trichoplax adhaerens]
MYVYLKDGQHLRYISRVSLADGCYPCVHNVLHEHKELVEPAIWFKVLVLDSICIDCSKRMFYWTTGHIGKHDLRLWTTEYGDMEFYDYDDDFDELFLLARKLLTEKNAIADKDLAETQQERRDQNVHLMALNTNHCVQTRRLLGHSASHDG